MHGLGWLAVLVGGCVDSGGAAADSADSGRPDTGMDTSILPVVVGEVCYPGPLLDDAVCLPTVAHDARWGADYLYPDPLEGSPQYAAPLRFLDLEAADPAQLLAPNFALEELMQAHKGRFGLFQRGTLRHLQAVRDALGQPVIVTSAYRNITYNAGVGGVTWSRHIYGDAADLQIEGRDLQDLADACTAEGAAFVSVYTAHVHCDWRDDVLDEAFFGEQRRQRTHHRHGPAVEGRLVWDGTGWRAPVLGLEEGEPLRVWTAWDGTGMVLERRVEGGRYVPPTGTRRVQVEVGGGVLVLAAAQLGESIPAGE